MRLCGVERYMAGICALRGLLVQKPLNRLPACQAEKLKRRRCLGLKTLELVDCVQMCFVGGEGEIGRIVNAFGDETLFERSAVFIHRIGMDPLPFALQKLAGTKADGLRIRPTKTHNVCCMAGPFLSNRTFCGPKFYLTNTLCAKQSSVKAFAEGSKKGFCFSKLD